MISLSHLGNFAEALLFVDQLGHRTNRNTIFCIGTRDAGIPRQCHWIYPPPPAMAEILQEQATSYICVWVGSQSELDIGLQEACYTRGAIVITIELSHRVSSMKVSPYIITIRDPLLRAQMPREFANPLAIIATYNEADVIEEVILDLLTQQCDVFVIDNWSIDGTVDVIRSVASRYPERIAWEIFPDTKPSHGEWRRILRRKEEIAAQQRGRWIIHSDADEIRRFPKEGVSLRDGFEIASAYGANRINFCVINFAPVDTFDCRGPLLESLRHFEFGKRPAHYVQHKAWLQGEVRVDLASSGGHTASFKGAVDFPYRWLVQHFPIRSIEHGHRKILHERKLRWDPYERNHLGWHVHYDQVDENSALLGDETLLYDWNEEAFWNEHGLAVICEDVQRNRENG